MLAQRLSCLAGCAFWRSSCIQRTAAQTCSSGEPDWQIIMPDPQILSDCCYNIAQIPLDCSLHAVQYILYLSANLLCMYWEGAGSSRSEAGHCTVKKRMSRLNPEPIGLQQLLMLRHSMTLCLCAAVNHMHMMPEH